MSGHDFRALVLALHLKAWRWLHPARRRWMPRALWWRFAPTIRLAVHAAASLDQSGFQFYNDDGTESTATSVAAEDTNATLDVDTVYHLRVQIDDTASGAENNVNFQLQYNLNSAGWNNVDGTSSVVQSAASQLTDGGDTTARLTAPTGGSFISPNSGQDDVDGVGSDVSFSDGTHDYVETVYGFQILSGDVQDADTIQFRAIRTGGTVLESYGVTPQATVSESSTGQTVTVGQAVETDTAQTVGSERTVSIGQAVETDTAQAVTYVGDQGDWADNGDWSTNGDWAGLAGGGTSQTVGQASETDTAQPLGAAKTLAVGQLQETDTAQPVTAAKTQTVGQAVEIDTAQPVGAAKTESIGQAVATDTAQAVAAAKTYAIGQATETDTAQAVTAAKTQTVGQALETDTAQPVTAQGEVVAAIGQALETDTAQPVSAAKTYAIGQALETDTAQAVGAAKTDQIGQAAETDTAQAVGSAKTLAVGQAAETDTAQPVSSTAEQVVAIGQATETDTAQTLGAEKTAAIGQATETDTAQSVTTSKALEVGQATETDTAQQFDSSKTFAVAQAVETDTAGATTAEHTVTVGQPATTSTAFGLTWTKTLAVGQAIETDSALTVTSSGGAPVVLEVGSLAYYQFHRINGHLVLAPVGRSARRGFRTGEGFERVSDIIRVDQDASSAAHKSEAMETVSGVWATHSGSTAATLKTAIHDALQNAGFRGQGGTDLT